MDTLPDWLIWSFIAIVGSVTPLLVLAIFIRRQVQKKRFFAQPEMQNAPIEGTIEDLNRQDPNASPWTNDQRRRLMDTMEIAGRYNTMDGYSERYVDDLMTRLRARGIACEYVFQETMPMGVAAAIITRIGTCELFVDRQMVKEATQVIEEFRAST